MENQTIIDLNLHLSSDTTALVGRDRGETLAKKIFTPKVAGIPKELEAKYKVIVINIPPRIVSMNKSYFLGFFEAIIQRLGRDAFLSKYIINGSDYIKNKISSYVEAALLKSSQGEILDVD